MRYFGIWKYFNFYVIYQFFPLWLPRFTSTSLCYHLVFTFQCLITWDQFIYTSWSHQFISVYFDVSIEIGMFLHHLMINSFFSIDFEMPPFITCQISRNTWAHFWIVFCSIDLSIPVSNCIVKITVPFYFLMF